MSYESQEEIKKLDKDNKQLLKHLVEKTGAVAVGTAASDKELKSQGRIIDNIDKNYNIADANLKKAHYVEEHYESIWGWVKSIFKKKPKNANNYEINARKTDEKIEDSNINLQVTKERIEYQQNVLKAVDDAEYKDQAYEAIKMNIKRIKANSESIGEELDEQNRNFNEQKYSKEPHKYQDFNKGPSKLSSYK